MSDSITRNFERLGIPLVNQQWSWGASDERAVILRAWQDQTQLDAEGGIKTLVWQDWWSKSRSGRVSLGGKERLRQLAEVESGKPCYIVIIVDRWGGKNDPKRSIVPSSARPIFRAGEIQRDHTGKIWTQLTHRFKNIGQAAEEIAKLEAPLGQSRSTAQ